MIRPDRRKTGAYLPVSRQNISHFGREKVRGIKALFRFKAPPENPRVGGSIPPLATINFRSLPVTSLTFYTGHIIDTLALKGFGAHSTRLVSSSKKPKS